MKRAQLLKYAVIAAGFLISAAFYVQMGPGGELLNGLEAAERDILEENASEAETGKSVEDEVSHGDIGIFFRDEAGADDKEGSETMELYELRGLSERQRAEVKELLENEMVKLRAELQYGLAEGTGPSSDTGEYLKKGSHGSSEGSRSGDGAIVAETDDRKDSGAGMEAQSSQSLININTATKEELMELKGIGETRALAIIEYRETYGGFAHIEEIMNISGIKEASFEKIKDRICV
ncbi:MAG TPA: helix-hairpin-helix domain-containing protein [Candidatus Avilachnospira avistercoris]|nr:helix-hairpin-helix domain-containing protein [Candidatus Avilachnospira avistercoris]